MSETEIYSSELYKKPIRIYFKIWQRLMELLLDKLLQGIDLGNIQVRFPSGRYLTYGQADQEPNASILIHNIRMVRKLLFEGDVGLAESYIDGDWDTPNLLPVLELGPRNMEKIEKKILGLSFFRFRNLFQHLQRGNNHQGSRRNIAEHYDLGNNFYQLWLDSSMTYSSALFEEKDSDLTKAQQAKYRKIVEGLKLDQEKTVLEIGCGWGGFAEFIAQEYGCRVEAITISKEQLNYAKERIVNAGLENLVEIRFQDYRDLEGSYDHIFSIEMLEAVGEKNWESYFQVIHKCLKTDGQATLQSITIDDARFNEYRKKADFIQLFVFPGGMLPSMMVLEKKIVESGMSIEDVFSFGNSYAETLKKWNEQFQNSWSEVSRLGFDSTFKRLWKYYLSYCETGFRTGVTNVVLLKIKKTN